MGDSFLAKAVTKHEKPLIPPYSVRGFLIKDDLSITEGFVGW